MIKSQYNTDSLSVDEATRLLGDFYLSSLRILTDRNKGVLTTGFSIAASSLFNASRLKQLLEVVLSKNGIEKIQADGPICHNYLPEIVEATERRGSDAAEEIRRYNDFVKACEQEFKNLPGSANMGFFKKVKARLDIAKTLQPE